MASVEAHHWDQTILQFGGSFLQSYAWGEFQRAYGRTVERWSGGGVAMETIVHRLPAGRTFLFTPYGPAGQLTTATATAAVEQMQHWASRHQAIFWRYERGGEQFGGRPVAAIHPAITWLTPLAEPAAMLAAMKQKWRYNIRLAEKKGVTITTSQAVAAVDPFYDQLQQTARRQGLRLHPKSYYQLLVNVLDQTDQVKLYFAEYHGRIIAAALTVTFGTTVTYVHGGSDYTQRQLMAPHLLHWQIMCDAYAAGAKLYDWFGIAPADQPQHRWASLTRFKQGFGGYSQVWDGTYELPLQPTWYNAYRLVKRTRLWI